MTTDQWWTPHPLDKYDQWKLLEIAESANPPDYKAYEYGDIEMAAKDGWKVVFFYDCGELDYIEAFVMPDGTRLNVWGTAYLGEQWPPVMSWRGVGDMERLRAFLTPNVPVQRVP